MANKKETTETMFTKEQFLNSKTYRQHRDLISVVLDGSKAYTKEEVNKIINKYKKGGK